MKAEPTDALLEASELFAGIAEQTMRKLLAYTRRLQTTAGQWIVMAGQQDDHLYLVGEGTVRLAFYGPQGHEKTVARLDRLKSFGLAELFSGRPYRYNVESMECADIVSIPGSVIRTVSVRDDRLARNLLTHLSRHFDALAQDIEYSIRYDALQRVVSYLLGTASGARSDVSARVLLPVRKNVIASRLGLTPETLSRSLMNLTGRGLIRVDGRNIILRDVGRLQALLEQTTFGETAATV